MVEFTSKLAQQKCFSLSARSDSPSICSFYQHASLPADFLLLPNLRFPFCPSAAVWRLRVCIVQHLSSSSGCGGAYRGSRLGTLPKYVPPISQVTS